MNLNKLTFHHIGVPVAKNSLSEKARYSQLFKMYAEEKPNKLCIRIEYHAFEEGSSLNKRLQTQMHTAFKVPDIEAALAGQEVVMPLYEPFQGYRCAMINLDGVLIELIQTTLTEEELWHDSDVLQKGILYAQQQATGGRS